MCKAETFHAHDLTQIVDLVFTYLFTHMAFKHGLMIKNIEINTLNNHFCDHVLTHASPPHLQDRTT